MQKKTQSFIRSQESGKATGGRACSGWSGSSDNSLRAWQIILYPFSFILYPLEHHSLSFLPFRHG